MNRHARRKAEAQLRQKPSAALERDQALRIAAALFETDRTVSGATLITPDGDVTYLDADAFRRGGSA